MLSPMWTVQVFWLALALPGFALLCRFDRRSLAGGVLLGLAKSYLVSCMLLTPVSVLGHLLHWPLSYLSGAYLGCVALGTFSLLIDRSWVGLVRRPSAVAAIGGILILADLWFAARTGAHTGGDAGYQVARVRSLVELGLNSWDPLTRASRVDPVYHTNLYHALIASSAQLTANDAAIAWLYTWPFCKLLTAAGTYWLALVVMGQRGLAFCAAVGTAVYYASYSVLPFPNTLAPAALLPMGLAAGVQALCCPHTYRPALWLAAASLMLAQTHALNAAFLGLVVGPCLLLLLLYRGLRGHAGRRHLVVALIACGLSLPWLTVPALPLVSTLWGTASSRVAGVTGSEVVAAVGGGQGSIRKAYKSDYFEQLEGGLRRLAPAALAGTNGRNWPLVYSFVFLALFRRRSRPWWALAAFVLMTCAWLVVPQLCTLLFAIFKAPWAVGRIGSVLLIALTTLVPAAPCAVFVRLPRWRFVRRVLEVGVLGLAIWFCYGIGMQAAPWTRQGYVDGARALRSAQVARDIQERHDFFATHVPAGASVMANPRWDYNLPMHHRCHTFALSEGRGFRGIADMPQRRALTAEFFASETSGQRRLAILRQYGVEYVYTSPRYAPQLIASMGERATLRVAARHGAIVRVQW